MTDKYSRKKCIYLDFCSKKGAQNNIWAVKCPNRLWHDNLHFGVWLIKMRVSETKSKPFWRCLCCHLKIIFLKSIVQFQHAKIFFYSTLQKNTYSGQDCNAQLACVMPRRDCFTLCSERWEAERLRGICLPGTDPCWQYGIHSKCKWEGFRSVLVR